MWAFSKYTKRKGKTSVFLEITISKKKYANKFNILEPIRTICQGSLVHRGWYFLDKLWMTVSR